MVQETHEDLLAATAKSIARSVLEDDTSSTTNTNTNTPNRLLQEDSIHGNAFSEKDGDDSTGPKSGINYKAPTPPPTPAPTSPPTPEPTTSPTARPTLAGREHILRGLMWYDRNANGMRDSNVNVVGMGGDVEYSHAVGGVSVQVIECDGDTGRSVLMIVVCS